MAKRNIIKYGDDILKKTCRPVPEIDDRILTLLDDMNETLKDIGVGLAAPQVGVLKRIVIVDVGNGVVELINPEIIQVSGEQTGPEGCLSCPGMCGIVTRPMEVTVKAQNRKGEWFTLTGTELQARAFCHEIDHLDGVMFLERAERMLSPDEFE